MKKIEIISSSIRINRDSHRVTLYFEKYLKDNQIAEVNIIDLKHFDFPIFEERLRFMQNPTAHILEVAERIKKADGIIIVTPEYNGGYPASLKNLIDLLYEEWKRKPIAISTVSSGAFGGTQVITSLQFSLWKIGALVVPAMFAVPTITQAFSEEGQPVNRELMDKKAKTFIGELTYWMDLKNKEQ